MVTQSDIQEALRGNRYRITAHAVNAMVDDAISESELIEATSRGEIIEEYPSAFPLPACLVLGSARAGRPLHAVWAFDPKTRYIALVTAYRPDQKRWTPDSRKRRVE